MAWEAAPPFIIIVLAIGAMGGLQSLVHKGFYGKPKAIGLDEWDRKLQKRDERILAEEKVRTITLAGYADSCLRHSCIDWILPRCRASC